VPVVYLMRVITTRLSVSLSLLGAFAFFLGCLAQGSRPLWYPATKPPASREDVRASTTERFMIEDWIRRCTYKIDYAVFMTQLESPSYKTPSVSPPGASGGGLPILGFTPGMRAEDDPLYNLADSISVSCLVAPDGMISDLKLTRSCGNPDMDKRALTLVKLASPFPPTKVRDCRRLVITFGATSSGGLHLDVESAVAGREGSTGPGTRDDLGGRPAPAATGRLIGSPQTGESTSSPHESSAERGLKGGVMRNAAPFLSDREFDAEIDRLLYETDLDLISEIPNVTRRGTTSPIKLEALAETELERGRNYLASIAYLSLCTDAIVDRQEKQAFKYLDKCTELSRRLDSEQAGALALIIIRFTPFAKHYLGTDSFNSVLLERARSIMESQKVVDEHVWLTLYEELKKVYGAQGQSQLWKEADERAKELTFPVRKEAEIVKSRSLIERSVKDGRYEEARRLIDEALASCRKTFGDQSIQELSFLVFKIKCTDSKVENRATALRIQSVVGAYPFYLAYTHGAPDLYGVDLTCLVRDWKDNEEPGRTVDDESYLSLARSAMIMALKSQHESDVAYISWGYQVMSNALANLRKPARLMSLYERITQFLSRSPRRDYRNGREAIYSYTEKALEKLGEAQSLALVHKEKDSFFEEPSVSQVVHKKEIVAGPASRDKKVKYELGLASRAMGRGDCSGAEVHWQAALESLHGEVAAGVAYDFASLLRQYETMGLNREKTKLESVLLEHPSSSILSAIDPVLQARLENLINSAALPEAEELTRKRLEAARKLSEPAADWSLVLTELLFVTGRKDESKIMYEALLAEERKAGRLTDLIEDRRDKLLHRLQ